MNREEYNESLTRSGASAPARSPATPLNVENPTTEYLGTITKSSGENAKMCASTPGDGRHLQ